VDIVLRPRLGRILLLVLGSAAFVAAGVWMLDRNRQVGMMSIVFFGACGVVGAVTLIPGAVSLRVGREGFQSCFLFIPRKLVRWSDIDSFAIYTVNRSRFLGWYWKWESNKRSKLSEALGTPDGSISTLFGSPEEILAIFEKFRH
jgi:hypothetical protein